MKEFSLLLPDTVNVSGDSYPIQTNFSQWLTFCNLLKNKETTLGEFDFLFLGTPPHNRIDAFNALYNFYNPPKELPRPVNTGNNDIVLDYITDFEFIYAAFLEQYNIDLYDQKLKLHWHKFLFLVSGLHDTELNRIIEIRSYKNNGNSKDKYNTEMMKLKNAWRLPQNMELSQATKDFNALLEKR